MRARSGKFFAPLSGTEDSLPEESEESLALEFSAKYAKSLRFDAELGRWLRWNGQSWLLDTTGHVLDHVRALCRAKSAACIDERVACKIATAKTVAAVERLARIDRRHAFTSALWDVDPWLLNTPAGVIDLRTGLIQPSESENYMTKMTSVGPGGVIQQWESFLDRISEGNRELVGFLKRMLGYVLTGNTNEHALFFLFGPGGNGKSVFLRTISGLMGTYAKTAPMETFVASRNERHPTDLAGLQGARLVTASEIEDGASWAESKLKLLTGGDRIAARFMRQDYIEFTPIFKLIIAGNHKPSLSTVDEAMRRRFNLIPFTASIPACERDPEVFEKLRSEWGGILQWMVEGCIEWQRCGLNPPPFVTEQTMEYLGVQDIVGQWLGERTVTSPANWAPFAALFSDYQCWCVQNGERPCSPRQFSEKVESKGIRLKRTAKARGFLGISLVTDMTEDSH